MSERNVHEQESRASADLTIEYITKRAKFKKRAEANVNKVLDGCLQLGRCSNRSLYAWTEEDVPRMFETMRAALDEAERRFLDDPKARGARFEL